MAILVGTASWAEKSLIDSGLFYPPDAKTPEARLRFYSSVFPLVEADSSYYAIPSPATAQAWVERTPPAFVMNVKAFRFLTGHATDPAVLPRAVRELAGAGGRLVYRHAASEVREAIWHHFLLALEPLRAAGKLGLVHFQFPPSVVPSPRVIAHVEDCVERLRGATVSIEFRHRAWWDGGQRSAETITWLRALGVVHTVVDGPQGAENSVPAVWEATHPEIALVRLHGRNAAAYNAPAKTAGERFDYDYPDHELEAIAKQVHRLSFSARNTHVVFNNCDRDKGQRNGMTMMRVLAELQKQPIDFEAYQAPNGMLARLQPEERAAAQEQLPDATAAGPQQLAVEVQTRHYGRVEVTFRVHTDKRHKARRSFWSACLARPI
ncbi:DUF72 domain-containing protein [uncultured Pseudacidovorax sp.]|uniref:DUF72 domain-containing protein n=1 Tax=uncultured Pseudacidovorax sp. TaxID=679313 RepID=UPI0025D429F0|nr:DUF72 domain-containing protein [uncultured Pseudacidovorax sp.]